MKLAIARLELNYDKWFAFLQAPDVVHRCIGVVANAEDIPDNVRDDGNYHLFQYDEQDQFCRYVPMDELADAMAQYKVYLDANGYKSFKDVGLVSARSDHD